MGLVVDFQSERVRIARAAAERAAAVVVRLTDSGAPFAQIVKANIVADAASGRLRGIEGGRDVGGPDVVHRPREEVLHSVSAVSLDRPVFDEIVPVDLSLAMSPRTETSWLDAHLYDDVRQYVGESGGVSKPAISGWISRLTLVWEHLLRICRTAKPA